MQEQQEQENSRQVGFLVSIVVEAVPATTKLVDYARTNIIIISRVVIDSLLFSEVSAIILISLDDYYYYKWCFCQLNGRKRREDYVLPMFSFDDLVGARIAWNMRMAARMTLAFR